MSVHSTELTTDITPTDLIANEIPSGVVNSINDEFTLANNPVESTVSVYLNGLIQVPGTGEEYTISGKIITFAKPPHTNSQILVNYANADSL